MSAIEAAVFADTGVSVSAMQTSQALAGHVHALPGGGRMGIEQVDRLVVGERIRRDHGLAMPRTTSDRATHPLPAWLIASLALLGLGQADQLRAAARGVRDGGADLTGQMERLHKSCRRLIWLNPLLGTLDYAPVFGDLGAVITPDRTILLDVSRDYFATMGTRRPRLSSCAAPR